MSMWMILVGLLLIGIIVGLVIYFNRNKTGIP